MLPGLFLVFYCATVSGRVIGNRACCTVSYIECSRLGVKNGPVTRKKKYKGWKKIQRLEKEWTEELRRRRTERKQKQEAGTFLLRFRSRGRKAKCRNLAPALTLQCTVGVKDWNTKNTPSDESLFSLADSSSVISCTDFYILAIDCKRIKYLAFDAFFSLPSTVCVQRSDGWPNNFGLKIHPPACVTVDGCAVFKDEPISFHLKRITCDEYCTQRM